MVRMDGSRVHPKSGKFGKGLCFQGHAQKMLNFRHNAVLHSREQKNLLIFEMISSFVVSSHQH